MKRTKLAFILFSILLTSSVIYAQGRGQRNVSSQYSSCDSIIPNLTDEQKNAIEKLQTKHYKTIDNLREKRRSTTDEKTKIEIRLKMLDAKENHQENVLALLNKEQQQTYNANQGNGNNQAWRSNKNYGRNQNTCRNSRGNRNYPGKGNGYRNSN